MSFLRIIKINLIIIILFLLIFEFFLYFSFKIFNNKFSENLYETELRHKKNYSLNLNLSKSKSKNKIAIFGGSTAAGFASSLGFDEIIKKLAPEKIELINFAAPGDPFNNYQSKLIKTFGKNFNNIIIYAGHNEIWSHLYDLSEQNNNSIVIANGSTANYAGPKKDLAFRIGLYSNNINLSEKLLYYIKYKTRIYNFVRRISNKAKLFSQKSHDQKKGGVFSFFYNDSILNYKNRKIIAQNYTKKIRDISNELNNVNIIISTLTSNEFYPPIYDTNTNKDLKKLNILTRKIYKNLSEKKFHNIDNLLIDYPQSAHLDFFKLLKCSNKKHFSLCFDHAYKARQQEKFFLRNIHEINENIRQLKNKNIKVIDNEKLFVENLKNLKNVDEYHSYFKDYQHLSPLGHIFIANEIMKKIFNDNHDIEIIKYDNCENFILKRGKIQKIFNNELLSKTNDINLKWLLNSLNYFGTNIGFKFHLENIKKLKNCI